MIEARARWTPLAEWLLDLAESNELHAIYLIFFCLFSSHFALHRFWCALASAKPITNDGNVYFLFSCIRQPRKGFFTLPTGVYGNFKQIFRDHIYLLGIKFFGWSFIGNVCNRNRVFVYGYNFFFQSLSIFLCLGSPSPSFICLPIADGTLFRNHGNMFRLEWKDAMICWARNPHNEFIMLNNPHYYYCFFVVRIHFV